ncbi:hypothetical protein ACQUFY_21650 [Robbsia andropogonis]|uniref:hypothetical protein n=1 Tax=Robbsia andropogonis TaxID=28092 RepID=UPI003D1FAB77
MPMLVLVFFLIFLPQFARAGLPDGVREIVSNAFDGRTGRIVRSCAFWANDAAAAVRRREQGMSEEEASRAVGMPDGLKRPTDADIDFYGRRAEVVAQVYQSDDLQQTNPKQIHDVVFSTCQAEAK